MNDRLLLIFSGLLLCLAGMPGRAGAAATALPDDIEVSHSFDRSDYMSGGFGNISLYIRHPGVDGIRLFSVRVRTDWLGPAESYVCETASDTVIPAGGSSTCRVPFRVPPYIKAADHAWNISIDYSTVAAGGPNLTWSSETRTDLRVSDFDVAAYPVSMTITAGQMADFTITLWGRNGFNKTVTLLYRAVLDDDYEHQIWGPCYPGWVQGSGVAHAYIMTNSSTRSGKYEVMLMGLCEDETTFSGAWSWPGIQRHAVAFLKVADPPKAFVDISANCAAQLGIGAAIMLAAVTAALFAAESRKKRTPPR